MSKEIAAIFNKKSRIAAALDKLLRKKIEIESV